MKNTALRQTIEQATQSALLRIKEHPFIQLAHQHELTRDQSIRWVKCAGRESRTFPDILEEMIKRCDNTAIKAILQENLDDEYGNGNPEHAHFKHYLHLLDKLGVPRTEFENYPENVGIALALSLAKNIAQQPKPSIAIGYMLVNEGMTPITYEAARSTLTHYFPDLQTTFFDMHIEVDEHHVAELYRAIENMDDSAKGDLLFGVSIGERGMAVLLDEALGIFDTFRYCKCKAKCAA